MIQIERKVFSKTKATRQEIEQAYLKCLNAGETSRGFEINGQVLGVDRQRINDFIFWCYDSTK